MDENGGMGSSSVSPGGGTSKALSGKGDIAETKKQRDIRQERVSLPCTTVCILSTDKLLHLDRLQPERGCHTSSGFLQTRPPPMTI